MGTTSSPIHFPNAGYQVLTSLIYFLGLTTISHYISRRIQYESLTFNGIKNMSRPRLWAILMFCESWLFLLSSGILIFGIGLEYSKAICTVAIYLCIFFYASSKLFFYAFLAEKVYIVWSRANGVRRFESPVYLTCVVSVSFYCIVMTLMLGGPIHEFASDGTCVIGLRPFGYIPLLTYDVYISIFLTVMFLVPLFRTDQLVQPKFKRLAIRTLIAAAISISTSTTNVVVLMVLNGRESAWINLAACSTDIIVNASAVYWVLGRNHNPQVTGAVHSDQYRSFRHPNYISSRPSRSTPDTNSDPNIQYAVQFEEDPKIGADNLRSPNSWVQRILNREKLTPMPSLQISVTREIELKQRDSPIPV